MDGITILYSYTQWPIWRLLAVALAIILTFWTLVFFLTSDTKFAWIPPIIGLIILLALMVSPLPVEQYYEIIVSDSTPYATIAEKYTVIKQEGLIYTVREKKK